ncbi:transcriptional regulator [Nocardia terpenica]|nr:transcriptional regulator [Nocardia terpenica]
MVVDRASAVGVELAYDYRSVGRWLDGEKPYPPGPVLIAEVMTEALGRRITPLECGMAGDQEPADLGLEFSLSLVEATASVTALWRSDVERRRFLIGASYAVAVYPAASMRWLTLPGPEHPVSMGVRRVGQSDIDSIRMMTAAFRELDNKAGGGRVRATIVQYLHGSVAPLLRGNYAEPIGRQLFATTAELTKLAGWAAYDQEEHGLAQRYLIQALRLARAAGDAGLGAEILAAMSHQATYVGRPGDAVDLARAAQIAARSAGLAALESECHMVEAHGHAARTDDSMCAKSINAAERAFSKDVASDRPAWLSYFDGAYMSAKVAHCFRDLGDDARTAHFAEQSLDMSDGYLRGRAFNLALLASARVEADPHEAVRVGRQALDIATGLASRRSYAYLRELRTRLSPYTQLPDVDDFRNQVLELTKRRE